MGSGAAPRLDQSGFWLAMHRRIEFGCHKYGQIPTDEYRNKEIALRGIKKKLAKYEETGNPEFLIDVANFAMIEFNLMHGFGNRNFRADDDNGHKWWNSGG